MCCSINVLKAFLKCIFKDVFKKTFRIPNEWFPRKRFHDNSENIRRRFENIFKTSFRLLGIYIYIKKLCVYKQNCASYVCLWILSNPSIPERNSGWQHFVLATLFMMTIAVEAAPTCCGCKNTHCSLWLLLAK